MTNTPATEERVWAVLSHLSALAFGMGILLPVIGWSEQRRKSNYASFQCLQALGYQSLGYTIWLLSYLLLVVLLLVVMAFGVSASVAVPEKMDTVMGVWVSVFFAVIAISFGVYILLPVIAAASCAMGRDFRYPIMGNRLARYLGYDAAQIEGEQAWLIEDHEDRWVAGMGHFSVIIILWGMVVPLIAWIMQGKRSAFLKFQSIQTLAYQGGTLLLYFGAGFVYFFGFLIFMATVGLNGNADMNSSMGIGLVVFAISMLITFVVVLIVPLLHILGQWAGFRVLKGDDYRYPILGKLIERRMNKTPKSVESKSA